MFDVLVLIFFGVMSYRIFSSLRRESSLFSDYKQSQKIRLLILLFPLGPLVLFLGSMLLHPPFSHLIALCCYVPTMFVARQQTRGFETAGTDKVQNVLIVLNQAFGIGLAGLIYVAVSFVFVFGTGLIK
jgi:hypothetical protein